jgi:uncharacterized protein
MSSTNQSPQYFAAEEKYLSAQTIDEKINRLQEMIRLFKKHKGSEKMLAELRTRLKKLKSKQSISKKSGKGKKGIRKEHFQCVLIGLPNSGKSSLLAKLTNAKPKITPHPFSTTYPEIGTMQFEGVSAQIIDLPSISSENFSPSITHTADCLLITLSSLDELEKISPIIEKSSGSKIIIMNKSDLLNSEQLRKLEATLKSKKLNSAIVSTNTNHNIEKLKELIFKQMHVIRVYTKEPGKPKTHLPIVLPEGSTVKQFAEKILKGFSQRIKETHLTGPSSKFPNQRVGLNHVCKDLDIIEFHTK